MLHPLAELLLLLFTLLANENVEDEASELKLLNEELMLVLLTLRLVFWAASMELELLVTHWLLR